jgi:hypothetical protein
MSESARIAPLFVRILSANAPASGCQWRCSHVEKFVNRRPQRHRFAEFDGSREILDGQRGPKSIEQLFDATACLPS